MGIAVGDDGVHARFGERIEVTRVYETPLVDENGRHCGALKYKIVRRTPLQDPNLSEVVLQF